MEDIYKLLSRQLSCTKKLAILGVGSPLKSDDAAGIIITERLKKYFNGADLPQVSIYTGESAPENYTGKIKRLKPDHIIIIDAADIKENPGDIKLIQPDAIDGTSFSTHMLPMKIMIDYLIKETGCSITVIGIQPKSLSFAGDVTPQVLDSIECIISALKKIIMDLSSSPSLLNPQA